VLAPGVRAIEHTADIGMDVQAGSLADLFHHAALGMSAFLHEGEDSAVQTATRSAARPPESDAAPSSDVEPVLPGGPRRELNLEADDVASLLVQWLRELLYLHDVHGLAYRSAEFRRIDGTRLQAVVALAPDEGPEARELKGVTYHELQVEAEKDGWRARVIFDV
jgi:protein archease